MYNKELKARFLGEYTGSLKTREVAVQIFNVMEKFETQWGADLCTRSKEELQPAIDEVVGLRSRSKWMALIILKEYVKWCIAMGVPDARDDMLQIDSIGLGKIRRQMVSGPLHLQTCLDSIFAPESDMTISNLYRCYFWMAFCGIDEDDTILITNDDVDFQTLSIRYKDTHVPIYRESIAAFRNAVSLTSFKYKHPNYSEDIDRPRVSGNTIMRGIKSGTLIDTVRTTVSRHNIKAIQRGATDVTLSFRRVALSGLFHRANEYERAGMRPEDVFQEVSERKVDEKNDPRGASREKKIHRSVLDYMEDYNRWKLAFML